MVKKSLLHDITSIEIRSRGYLPHWHQPGATYSVTLRLHDSLPRAVIDRLREEHRLRQQAIADGTRQLTSIEKAQLRAQFDDALDRELNRGLGTAFMNDPAIADLVANTLMYFDGTRYELHTWCVMPNHVHVIVTPIEGWTLNESVHSWKGYSARMANRMLSRQDAFWQREYFDRIIRDEKHLADVIAYVMGNPEKAGLNGWRWIGVGRLEVGGTAG